MGKKLRLSLLRRLLESPSSDLPRESKVRTPAFTSSGFPPKGRAFDPGTASGDVRFSNPSFIGLLVPVGATNAFCTSSFSTNPATVSRSSDKPWLTSASEGEGNETHVADFDAKAYLGIARSVISKCSYLWEHKAETFVEKSFSLQDLLKLYGDLSPQTTRRFWRVSVLKPEDIVEILLGFGPEVNLRKVDFLWKLFRWAAKQSGDFHHLPRAYEIMISMLVRVQMLGEAEFLLLLAEARGVISDANGFFSEIIQGYAESCKLENSMALYEQARDRALVPSASCYQALLDLLIRMEKSESVLRVYMDMIKAGFGSNSEGRVLDYVIISLTKNEKLFEAINVLRLAKSSGIEAGPKALTAIAEGFCKRKDFDDMFNFLKDWEHIPEACVCNKIVSSLCKNLGTEEAWSFVQNMEPLGFVLNDITLGIVICHSCREGKLRNAFIYLSEGLSRDIAPNMYVYNALISGIFKEGLYKHAKYVFEDMVEKGLIPDLSTFKVLLAGYCKFRKFDEVKQVLDDMINHGIISSNPMEDALSRALMILGLDHLKVKVKRDNDVGLPKAEFFDPLGNGLYLETDIEEYETALTGILESARVPSFDSKLIRECHRGDIADALNVKDEVVQWGLNLSLSSYAELLKGLCAFPSQLKEAVILIDEMSDSANQLDCKILNLLIQTFCENGMTTDARSILEVLFRRELLVDSDTYSVLIKGFCRERNITGLLEFLELAQRSTWLPRLKDIKALTSCLCNWGMIKEVLEHLHRLMEKHPNLIPAIYSALLKELCITGYTNVSCILMEELLQKGLLLNHAVYVNLVEGFLKEQKFAEALGIFDILLEKKIIPCPNVYKLSLHPFLCFDRADKLISLKQPILTKWPKAGSCVYSTIMEELCRAGKTKEAAAQLGEMLENRTFPKDNAWNALLQRYCHESNVEKAYEIFCIMLRLHANLSVSSFRSLIRQLLMHGQLNGALNLKELIQGEHESQELILYNVLIFHLFQTGNSLVIETLLQKMQDTCILPDKDTYDFLIYGFSKCGNVTKSIKALDTILHKGLRPSNRSLRVVISHLCSQGKVGKALELSKVMEHNGWKHGSVVQYALAAGLLSCGRLCEAEILLDGMEQKNLIPNSINYDLLIREFIVANGGLKKAIDLLNLMLTKGNIPSETSYSLIIDRLCISKAFDRALDFYAEMRHKNLKPHMETCDALICGLCANGRTDDAKHILGTMLQLGPIPAYSMYSHVINRYYTDNNLVKASELFQEMQQAGYSPNFDTHWSLISNLSSSDRTDDQTGKGLLSRLLFGSSHSVNNKKKKGISAFRYAS